MCAGRTWSKLKARMRQPPLSAHAAATSKRACGSHLFLRMELRLAEEVAEHKPHDFRHDHIEPCTSMAWYPRRHDILTTQARCRGRRKPAAWRVALVYRSTFANGTKKSCRAPAPSVYRALCL
jgi:hypothetical protein